MTLATNAVYFLCTTLSAYCWYQGISRRAKFTLCRIEFSAHTSLSKCWRWVREFWKLKIGKGANLTDSVFREPETRKLVRTRCRMFSHQFLTFSFSDNILDEVRSHLQFFICFVKIKSLWSIV